MTSSDQCVAEIKSGAKANTKQMASGFEGVTSKMEGLLGEALASAWRFCRRVRASRLPRSQVCDCLHDTGDGRPTRWQHVSSSACV